jgi:phosphotriesterase-related protein
LTVNGQVKPESGIIFTHEHIVTDFRRSENNNQSEYDFKYALKTILPHLRLLKAKGVNTIFECTPNYIGRDVRLLKALSDSSGINLLTNTGFYAAMNKNYLPPNIQEMSSRDIYNIWKYEWVNGIDDSRIRPGFIKLGVGNGKLDSLEEKILTAAVRLSKETKMTIAIHTGDGEAAFSEYEIIKKLKLKPSKVIWVHAQNGTNEERLRMANKGMWISLDGISEYNLDEYIEMIEYMKSENVLNKLLISHDDGWSVVEDDNNKVTLEPFKEGYLPYITLLDQLIPILKELQFSKSEIEKLLYQNAISAFSLN